MLPFISDATLGRAPASSLQRFTLRTFPLRRGPLLLPASPSALLSSGVSWRENDELRAPRAVCGES